MTQKTYAALVIALVLILLPASAGCRAKAPVAADKPTLLDSLTDEQLISRYVEGLDIALTGDNELLFSDSSTIPSQTLYMFFMHAVLQDKLYDADTWLYKGDEKYHIPLNAVTATIGKYFGLTKFEPTEIRDYVPANKEFVTSIFAGFGGGRFIKLRSKESLSATTIRLTADFYDGESFKNIVYTKVYTVEVGDAGYKYVSITKLH